MRADPTLASLERDAFAPELRPALPGGPGGAAALVAVLGDARPLALLPAFALPLRVRSGADDAAALPPAVLTVAEAARGAVGARARDLGVGLELPQDAQALSIADWPLEFGSAFATLFAAFAVVAFGGAGACDVVASATRGAGGGFGPVDESTLHAKLAAARRHRASEIHVAAPNLAAALALAPAGLSVRALPTDERDLERAADDLLRTVGAEPTEAASFDRKVDWHERLPDKGAQDRFYERRILPDQKKRAGAVEIAGLPCGRPRPEVIITALSESPHLALATLALLRPRAALVLTTRKTRQHGAALPDRLAALLRDHEVELRCEEVAHDRVEEAEARVRAYCAGKAPHAVAIDATPGTKPMTLGAILGAPGGAAVIYRAHERNARSGNAVAGSEEYIYLFEAARGA